MYIFQLLRVLFYILVLNLTVLLLFSNSHSIRLIEGVSNLTLCTTVGLRTSASYWKAVWDKNPDHSTSNPYLIAARIRRMRVKKDDINAVLKHHNISVSDNQLKELANVPPVDIGSVVNKDLLNTIVPSVTVPRTKVSKVQPIT